MKRHSLKQLGMKRYSIPFYLALLAALFLAGPAVAETIPDFLSDAPQACADAPAPQAPSAADLDPLAQLLQFDTGTEARPIFGGGQCNQAVCGAGQFCCNYSCSVCAPIGGACLDVYCPPVS